MKNKYLLVSVLIFTLFISGCSDNTDDTDDNDSTPTVTAPECEIGEVLNLETNECELNTTEPTTCNEGEVLNTETNECELNTTEPTTCNEGEVLNPETNECESETTEPTACDDGFSWNGETCVENSGAEINCTDGFSWNLETEKCETVIPICEGEQHWDPFEESCTSCETGAVWNQESLVCECNAEEGLTANKNGVCVPFKEKCEELERFWNEELAIDYTVNACEVWKDCPVALPNSTRNDETNLCECNEYFTISADEKICEIDFTVVPNAISGKVFDGVVENATISVCEIIDGVKTAKTVEDGAMCEASNSAGEFRCGFLEEIDNTVVLKAVGGTDLGLDGVESEDDSENRITTKTAVDSVKNGDTVVITPATSLIVQRMSDSNWTETLSKAMNFVHSSVAEAISNTQLSDEDAQVSALIAKLYYTLPEADRENVIATLSKTEGISSNLDLISLLTDDERLSGKGTIITYQINKISDSIKIELTSDEITQIEVLNTTLNKVIELDGNFSTKVADNFDKIFAEENLTISDEVLLIISQYSDAGFRGDVVETAKNIQCILSGASDRELALQIIHDWLENRKALDGNCEDLLMEVEEDIIALGCSDSEEYISGEGCVEKVVCETGFALDVETRTCVEVVKDAVNSPEDVPALPNTSPSVIVEDTFPSIPSETAVSMPTDNALDMPSDDDYTDPWATTGEINDTVPFSTN